MKRLIALALSTAMVLSFASCSSEPAETTEAEQTAVVETEASQSDEQIPNPWTETNDILEAISGSGISDISYPSDGSEDTDQGMISWYAIRYTDGMIELQGYIGAGLITIRKGLDSLGEDISGDYNTYDTTYTRGIATCRSYAPDAARVVTWQANGFSYSVVVQPQGDDDYSYGLTDDTVNYFVEMFE